MGEVYHFGRGSSSCLRVEVCPGNYCEIGMGNVKHGEKGLTMHVDKSELHRLAMFFLVLWRDQGEKIFTSPLIDDPHDSIIENPFEFSDRTVETSQCPD